MIEIKKESADFYLNTKVYESCIFCDNETDTWNIKSNQPICEDCSSHYNYEDIIKFKNL